MVSTFHCACSHLEMQLSDITIVSVMVLDAYTTTDTDPIYTAKNGRYRYEYLISVHPY